MLIRKFLLWLVQLTKVPRQSASPISPTEFLITSRSRLADRYAEHILGCPDHDNKMEFERAWKQVVEVANAKYGWESVRGVLLRHGLL